MKQFQSLESVSVEVEGFTVITGITNVGKSALVRAVGAAVFGMPGDHYIRYGAAQCGVGIADTDLKLKWYKVAAGKAGVGRTTSLELNGVTHTKIGKEQAALTVDYGLREIETSGPTLRPQIAMQHDPIFLLTQSPATVAEVLKLLGRVDVVTEAQRRVRKDCKEVEGRAKVREQDIEQAKERVTELGDLNKWVVAHSKVSNELANSESTLDLFNSRLLKMEQFVKCVALPVPEKPELVERPAEFGLLVKAIRWMGLQKQEVPELPTLMDGVAERAELVKKIGQWQRQGEEREQVVKAVLGVDAEAATLEVQRVKLEEELKVCPTCGRGFGN